MTISIDPTPMSAARVGDLITYSYDFVRWGFKDSTMTTRKVTLVIKDGAGKTLGYYVEGGYRVELKQVHVVIPTHEDAPPPVGKNAPGFPMEPGQ